MRRLRQSHSAPTQPIYIRLTAEQWPSEARIRHLELIEPVVTGLVTNSFIAKGWALTVAGAIYGFAATHLNPGIACGGLLATLGFWWLDAYYLLHERLFRCLYSDSQRPQTSVPLFSMNFKMYKKGKADKTTGRRTLPAARSSPGQTPVRREGVRHGREAVLRLAGAPRCTAPPSGRRTLRAASGPRMRDRPRRAAALR
jgi:hypothetical protein